MAVIFDAVNVDALPPGADAYIGYVDGSETAGHYNKVRAKFPKARIITVSTVGAAPAEFIDCERFDATPAQAVAGVRAGNYTGIYCSTEGSYGIQVVRSLNPPPFDWFAAHYTFSPHLEPGSVATQWTDNGGGGAYDISEALESWFTPPTPQPTDPTQEEEMASITVDSSGVVHIAARSPQGHLYHFVQKASDPSGWSVDDVTAKIAAAYPTAPPYVIAD